ncbi:calsyntenin-1-like [Biomphalaria glabrata]|uniref:Calsyntenin-1-like n=1 Tax=Biomphalaria glabrata TaxID=6526 RepID=A0A9W3A948_BIOGL|nr:calsyntenin-1-like [Biomphalaria glabrata]
MLRLLLLCIAASCCTGYGINRFKPVIWSKYSFQGKPVFFGLIRENETVVHFDPPLTAHDKDDIGFGQFVCAYHIHRSNPRFRKTIFPFEIVVVDKLIGLAVIRVKTGAAVSAKNKTYFKFAVSARDCGSPARVSDKAHVLIKVVSANDSVSFVRETYLAYVEEGHSPEAILTILPSDVERAVAFNSTCGYEILTPHVPFRLTLQGVLHNTEPLNHLLAKEYFFGVVAKNCRGDHSKPIFVKVVVTAKRNSSHAMASTAMDSGLMDHHLLGDAPELAQASNAHKVKLMMTVTVVTLGTIAVVVIVLLIIFKNRFSKSNYSDVYYDEEAIDLEWDNSTFDLLAPYAKRPRIV